MSARTFSFLLLARCGRVGMGSPRTLSVEATVFEPPVARQRAGWGLNHQGHMLGTQFFSPEICEVCHGSDAVPVQLLPMIMPNGMLRSVHACLHCCGMVGNLYSPVTLSYPTISGLAGGSSTLSTGRAGRPWPALMHTTDWVEARTVNCPKNDCTLVFVRSQGTQRVKCPCGAAFCMQCCSLEDVCNCLASWPATTVIPTPSAREAKRCYKCDKEGHLYKECPTMLCYACSKFGHLAAECPQPAQERRPRRSAPRIPDHALASTSVDPEGEAPAVVIGSTTHAQATHCSTAEFPALVRTSSPI